MTSAPRRRIEALNKQLWPLPDAGTFEDIPKIKKVAGPSAGQRCKGKVVIITGANSPLGIGRATAHQYAENGARAIFICDLDDTHLDTHKREIQSLYPEVEVHPRQIDAAEEQSVEGVVKEAVRMYERLDVFFANAGIVGQSIQVSECEVEDFKKTLEVNVISVFLAAKHASKAMQLTSSEKPQSSGSVIATASVAGLRSNAGGTDYSASKAAVVSIVQTCAYQLQRTNVRFNAICPGLIETGMTEIMYEMARQRGSEAKIGQLNPTGRGAVADEVARVALFLGSDEASYVNGQAWAVCGGLSAGHPVVPGKLG